MNRIYHILILLGLIAIVRPEPACPQGLEIHCIDVGQGSSELIIGPDGTTILIDGGTSSKGRDEVIPYLDALFSPATAVLNYIIASHDHDDHYGGLNYIIDHSGYSIDSIYHCGDNASFGEGTQIPLGTIINLGDGARATCIGRYGEFIDGSTGATDDNNESVCLLIEYGGFDYITSGDLADNEDELSTALIEYPPSDPYLDPAYGADVIHVNHHGSDGASHSYYVNRLKHEVALINGGTNYGHPCWTAVDRLKGRANYSDGSGATGVTWTGCTSVYRTTYDDPVDGRAPEWDCPTLGDIVVTYDGCAENYYVAGTPYPVDEWIVCTTPSPTPVGYHTPSPTSTIPPTPSPTTTLTPTPSATPTPEGYHTPTPTPSVTPSPSLTPTPMPSPTAPPAVFPFYEGFESGVLDTHWSVVTDNEGRVRVSADYPYAGTYSALLDCSSSGTYSTAALVLTIDLSAQTEVDLSFQWREFNDENHAEDGVFISDDFGGTWSQLTSFNNGPSEFTSALFDLSAAATAAGLSLNDHFQVKFQMYDNFRIPSDGYAIDDVRVWQLVTPTPSPSSSPTPEGYRTPTPTPSATPTITVTPSVTPTLSATTTPEGYKTPSPSPAPEAVYVFALESDPGWTTDSDWAFGQPSGVGSYDGDPYAGYTGSNVYGYNLSGDYPNDLSPEQYLTTTALDCSEVTGVSLRFYRWLGVESSDWDQAGIDMSTDGLTWSTIWKHSGATVSESDWSLQTYSLSPGADREPEVYLRWGIGTTDGSVTYPGWNIDDIEIWGTYDIPTPTPVPTATPTPTTSPTSTPTPTATPTLTATPTPTATPPPSPSPTSTATPTTAPTPTLVPTPSPALTPQASSTPSPTLTPAPPSTPSSTTTPITPTPSPTCGPLITPADIVLESGDFDGDGTDDIAIFRAASGLWGVRGVTRVYFGGGDDIPVPADYDGDWTSDIGIFRDHIGLWAIRGVTRVYFGGSGDNPYPNDYDGDGITDIAIFRGSTGLWALRGISRIYFGAGDDRPIPGDYSGSGNSVPAVFRPSSGLWAVRGYTRIYYGASGDWALPGDYDGDGTDDQAVFRGCSGLWAIRGISRVYYGLCLDRPVQADYAGIGRDEVGIFRETSGLWAIRGLTRSYYGTSGDLPVTR